MSDTGIPADARDRDWRIDFWRGFAILMIFVNHLGPNVLTTFTTRHWGFSDAAELFVFLSGISFAAAFARRAHINRAFAIWSAARRMMRLYVHHLGLFLALGLLCAGYFSLTGSDALVRALQFGPFFERTETVLMRVATLTFLPSYTDILPLYIALTGFVAVLFYVAGMRPLRWLLASGALYILCSQLHLNFRADLSDRQWFFNPFAWQLLFVTGCAVWCVRDDSRFQTLMRMPAALALSGYIVGFGIVAAAPWTLDGALSDWRPFGDAIDPFLDKQNLSPLRYIHFLAAAHLATAVVSRDSWLRDTAAGRVFCVVGRNALPAFLFSTVLTGITLAGFIHWGHGFVAASCTGVVGVGAICLFAWARETTASGLMRLSRAH